MDSPFFYDDDSSDTLWAGKLQLDWFLCPGFDFDRYKCWRLRKAPK